MTIKCSVDGCDRFECYKGLCGKHYKRMWRNGTTERQLREKIPQCSVDGCDKSAKYTNGLCHTHWHRQQRHGHTDALYAEKGKGVRTTNAYLKATNPFTGKQDYLHRVLGAKALGKSLPEKAEMHHMNGDTHDNYTPFNLIICPDRAYHMLLEQRTREYEYRQKQRTRVETVARQSRGVKEE